MTKVTELDLYFEFLDELLSFKEYCNTYIDECKILIGLSEHELTSYSLVHGKYKNIRIEIYNKITENGLTYLSHKDSNDCYSIDIEKENSQNWKDIHFVFNNKENKRLFLDYIDKGKYEEIIRYILK